VNCIICGQYHPESTVCPLFETRDLDEPFTGTINGLTPGERTIVEKLDVIIKLLKQIKFNQ